MYYNLPEYLINKQYITSKLFPNYKDGKYPNMNKIM